MEHDVSVEDQEGFDNDIHITRKPSVFTVDATFETSTQTTPLKGKPGVDCGTGARHYGIGTNSGL